MLIHQIGELKTKNCSILCSYTRKSFSAFMIKDEKLYEQKLFVYMNMHIHAYTLVLGHTRIQYDT